MEINEILTIHVRKVENLVLTIVENGKFLRADKKKALK